MSEPREERLRWLLRAAALLHERGAEPVAGLVLPNNRYFPDRFDGSPAAVERLARRMMAHAGLDVPIAVQIVALEGEAGCSGGACSSPKAAPPRRLERRDDGYTVNVSAGEVGHATLLTTALARAASAAFLSEAELEEEVGRELPAFVDAAGALLGFGVLLANGAHVEHKGCGGVRVHQATTLPLDEMAALLAIFGQLNAVPARAARAELDPEPRRAFDEAARWAAANAGVIALCKTDRLAIDADSYRLAPGRGWLSRLFAPKGPSVPTDAELERVAADLRLPRGDAEKARRMAALRELVDESLD